MLEGCQMTLLPWLVHAIDSLEDTPHCIQRGHTAYYLERVSGSQLPTVTKTDTFPTAADKCIWPSVVVHFDAEEDAPQDMAAAAPGHDGASWGALPDRCIVSGQAQCGALQAHSHSCTGQLLPIELWEHILLLGVGHFSDWRWSSALGLYSLGLLIKVTGSPCSHLQQVALAADSAAALGCKPVVWCC